MNLQTILYGQFTPPPVTKVRKHRILQEGGQPYTPYTPAYSRVGPKPNQQAETIEKLTSLITDNPGADIKELAEMTGRCKSYVYRLVMEMAEMGMVKSVRGKPPRRTGPVSTLFYMREAYAG